MNDEDSNNRTPVTHDHGALWQRISAFSVDRSDSGLPFSRRLASENGWSADYARRVIAEYTRFALLATVAGHPVTPSDPVDQVWHLHLAYSRSYWEDFCPNVLGTALHHEPTQGSLAEQEKFLEWYRQTLASYERLLGQAPPADIWPAPSIRFCRDTQFVRVSKTHYWLIPKPGAQNLADTDRHTTIAPESARYEPTFAHSNVLCSGGCAGCGGCGGCGG